LSQGLQKAYEKGPKDAIESFEKQVKELRQERDRHVAKLRRDYPLFAATKYAQPMGIEHAALKENEWVLEYEVTEPGTIIYLTRGKNLVKAEFKPVSRKEIDSLERRFSASLEMAGENITAQALAKFDFSTAKKLSDLLLADILPDLPKNSPLIIVPDGSLGIVPFETLVLNDGGKVNTDKPIPYVTSAEFFGDRNPVSYYQSVTALTLARTLGKQQKPGGRTLAMVDPVFSTDDARLVKTGAEKRRAMLDKLTGEKLMSFKAELALDIPRLPLTARLGESLKKADPEKTDLYEGLKAQKAVLLQKDLKPYRSVVFATHGYFGKDLPGIQEPVLILTLPGQPEGQDGFLRMTEVMSLDLNCDVAALTACQTGLGKVISGEGTMGMGRAFQYAGAKSVLMSLWSVAESSSVDLVTSFFRHLMSGKNKLEALRLARDEIRKAGYDHPFFWAPFILVGEVN
jgi:CHAT domain-containing protein